MSKPLRLFTDQLGSSVTLNFPPQRIVSLVPSQTELLYDLGLDKEVIGITKFCVHPEHWRTAKTLVGGTKTVDIEKIRSLHADLVIANKEENTKEVIEELRGIVPVWVSDIVTLNDALSMIESVGLLTNRAEKAKAIARQVSEAFSVRFEPQNKRVLYFIWRKPWMVAGSGTFINDLLSRIGFQNAAGNLDRYPELTNEQIQSLQPDEILLSSEPYPFADKHIEELRLLCPQATIRLVDGEMFSWYGSRLLKSVGYFKVLFNR